MWITGMSCFPTLVKNDSPTLSKLVVDVIFCIVREKTDGDVNEVVGDKDEVGILTVYSCRDLDDESSRVAAAQ